MEIPFVKAEGAGNDFLITLDEAVPVSGRAELARKLCHRHLGVGADGWYLVKRTTPSPDADPSVSAAVDAEIHLYNSDGSEAELSGNGTRCVVAWLATQCPGKTRFVVRTGAGLRHLHLMAATGNRFQIGMQMGMPRVYPEESLELPGDPATVIAGNRVDPGNPQFAVEVDSLDFPWKDSGRLLEGHPAFPNRSNISFYRVQGPHEIEARFYERGAGATLSSGTGSTGALAAAAARGKLRLPATVHTEAGPLHFHEEADGYVLVGDASILAHGVFYLPESFTCQTKGHPHRRDPE